MSIVYFGTGSFALPALRAVAGSVALVVTQPDRPSGRGMKLTPTPVKLLAQELGIPVATPEKSRNPEFVAQLEALHPDALLVASYGQILSQKMLDCAVHGGINLHGSILPAYRGAAPIQRAVLDGQTETGVTLMQMDRGMDTGNIIDILRTPIDPNESYGELQDRLAVLAAQMAEEWMPRILAGEYQSVPQESSMATMAPKIEKAEAELILSNPARKEHDRVRAFTPAPGAFIRTNLGNIRVWATRVSDVSGPMGEVLSVNPLTVAFGTGGLEFLEVQPEGKRRMSGKDFANGARLKLGSRLI